MSITEVDEESILLPTNETEANNEINPLSTTSSISLEDIVVVSNNDVIDVDTSDHTEETLGRGLRPKQKLTWLRDYVVGTVSIKDPLSLVPFLLAPHPPSGLLYPICNFVFCDRFSLNHHQFLMALTTNVEPRSFAEAMKHEHWVKAVDSEYGSLEESKTWRLEDLPPNKKALGCKWVFTIKYKYDGSIEHYNGRLVMLGNH